MANEITYQTGPASLFMVHARATADNEPQCSCLEYIGDDKNCKVHKWVSHCSACGYEFDKQRSEMCCGGVDEAGFCSNCCNQHPTRHAP